MPGKFEVYKDKKGEFRFRLLAANSQNILGSEGYVAKASCMKAIESVRKNSQNPNAFVCKTSASGKYTFSLKSSNGKVIGTSQVYDSESGCSNGMKSVSTTAPVAGVTDQTA
jgi:uncharacterized protein